MRRQSKAHSSVDKEYNRKRRKPLKQVTIPSNVKDSPLWQKVIKYQAAYSIIGLLVGFVCVLIGGILTIGGFAGNTKWIVTMFELKSEMTDAPPGIITMGIGVVIIFITKYSVKTAAIPALADASRWRVKYC